MREGEPRIYLLPNLMTAGNLFCGFTAILRIIEGALIQVNDPDAAVTFLYYHQAILLILGACVFDVLDGRMARMAGAESPFGREFDSLADIVSFGVAPALLVYRIVLKDWRSGWIIASVYLVCGALRLARFNCIAAAKQPGDAVDKDFSGIPIPAAAGVTASITLFMLGLQENDRVIGPWRYALGPLLLFLSWMMFSHFKYPSFKAVNWRTQKSVPRLICFIVLILLTILYYQWMPAILFISYLLYGFFRPFVSKSWRREIEEDDDDDNLDESTATPLEKTPHS